MAYGSSVAMKSSLIDATQEHGVSADSRHSDDPNDRYPSPEGKEALSRQNVSTVATSGCGVTSKVEYRNADVSEDRY